MAALVAMTCYLAFTGKSLTIDSRSTGFFSLAGILEVVGMGAIFFGLSVGDVMPLQTLTNTVPLWSLLFAYIFLRRVEVLSRTLIMGTPIVVAGALVVILF